MDQNIVSKRPWGSYEILDEDPGYKVKRITVLPGKRLSLQRHQQRAEHWFIIQGIGVATVGDKQVRVEPGIAVDIGKQQLHRIENVGSDALVFIEVQTGSYLGEDDIVRVEDDYGRI